MILHINKCGAMNILKNADEKIRKFNSRSYGDPELYHNILKARGENKSLVDESGRVGHKFLGMIEEALRGYFGMDKPMVNNKGEFIKNLKTKLESDGIRKILTKFRDVCIGSPNLADYKSDARVLYECLSAKGQDRLSQENYRFRVGATKVMYCLFPKLFVMLDRYVGRALGYEEGEYNNFEAYWATINICRQELKEWQELYGSTDSLLKLDQKPTTLTRIFDKCATIIGKGKA